MKWGEARGAWAFPILGTTKTNASFENAQLRLVIVDLDGVIGLARLAQHTSTLDAQLRL